MSNKLKAVYFVKILDFTVDCLHFLQLMPTLSADYIDT